MRGTDEHESLLATKARAGAGIVRHTYSILGFFSYMKEECEYYLFDIHAVCREGNYKALKEFVDAHPNPELLKRMANRLDVINCPPLYQIMLVGEGRITPAHLACTQLLLLLGADPNFLKGGDRNDSLLVYAIVQSALEVAALLIKHGAKFTSLGLKPLWNKRINEAVALSKTRLDFITEIKSEEEHETSHSESKKEL